MRKLTPREKRCLIYFALFLIVIGWDSARRYWSPDITISTQNYIVYSTATEEQTQEIGKVAEKLHAAYMSFLNEIKVKPQQQEKLKLKLYKNREEFRFSNRIRGWAEAFYREPYCHQYYSAKEANPYHWMVHEGTHQLNNEVAGFELAKWLEEGIADYFGTSRIVGNKLMPGEIDKNTYPIWWLRILATTNDLEKNKSNKSVIPLRMIISDSGGPDIDRFFNLYYLHWWSLTHFLFHYDNGKYKSDVAKLVATDADVDDFEKHIGKIEVIEQQWHGYVLKLKSEILGCKKVAVVPIPVKKQAGNSGE